MLSIGRQSRILSDRMTPMRDSKAAKTCDPLRSALE